MASSFLDSLFSSRAKTLEYHELGHDLSSLTLVVPGDSQDLLNMPVLAPALTNVEGCLYSGEEYERPQHEPLLVGKKSHDAPAKGCGSPFECRRGWVPYPALQPTFL